MDRECNDRRASYAYEKVAKISERDTEDAKSFRALARSFPIMIYNNGLGAAVSFLFAKKSSGSENNSDNAKGNLYTILQEWFQMENLLDKNADLMKSITESSNDTYRRMASETLALMGWVKRFSEGMIKIQ